MLYKTFIKHYSYSIDFVCVRTFAWTLSKRSQVHVVQLVSKHHIGYVIYSRRVLFNYLLDQTGSQATLKWFCVGEKLIQNASERPNVHFIIVLSSRVVLDELGTRVGQIAAATAQRQIVQAGQLTRKSKVSQLQHIVLEHNVPQKSDQIRRESLNMYNIQTNFYFG